MSRMINPVTTVGTNVQWFRYLGYRKPRTSQIGTGLSAYLLLPHHLNPRKQ